MVLVSLQQDFLPTDTVSMLEAPDDFSPLIILALSVLAIGFIIMIVSVYLAKKSESSSFKLLMFGVVVVIGGGVLLFIGGMSQIEEAQEDRDVALSADVKSFVSNIESVYEVKVLLPEKKYLEVSPKKERDIRVIQDGTVYEVVVVQDPDSYEPTLAVVSSVETEGFELKKR